VARNPTTKEIEVTSKAFQIKSVSGDFELFPRRALEEHSFCYFVVEPTKRHLTVWYMAHIPML
jgi:cilia- and flagella-associated protein 300